MFFFYTYTTWEWDFFRTNIIQTFFTAKYSIDIIPSYWNPHLKHVAIKGSFTDNYYWYKPFRHFAVVFCRKICVFIFFFLVFWWSIKLPEQNIKKLSVKRYIESLFPKVLLITFIVNSLIQCFWLNLAFHVLCIISVGLAR